MTRDLGDAPKLIARRVLFADPDRSAGKISPNGEWLGYVAPVNGILNVHIAKRGAPNATKVVVHDAKNGTREFAFAFDNRHVLYAQDENGDENYRIFAADLSTGVSRALTPKGARAEIDNMSAKVPDEVLISVNDRDSSYFDPVRVNITTGASRRLVENKEFTGFVTDEDFALRYASKQTPDGGKEWFVRDTTHWKRWSSVPQEDAIATGLGAFTADGKTLYMVDSRGRDRAGLFAVDTDTGARTLVLEDPRVDVGDGLTHPVTAAIQAVVVRYLKAEWKVLDPAIARDFAYLKTLAGDGEFAVDVRTQDDRYWIVRIGSSRSSEKTYLYDRSIGRAALWFDTQPAWTNLPFAPTHGVEIESRDGLTLPSYYILPPESDADGDGIPQAPVPIVLRVHGGPWARDDDRMNELNQWLANRGYAVLTVNFRGSTGFGKAFVNAGNLEWGGKMQEDLLDAVSWMERRGVAKPGKSAILGASYGGYAALAALTLTPKAFACGVSVVGPSNLNTLLATIPAYWGPTRRLYTTRVGDPDTRQGKALLNARSPLNHVQNVERPLLVGQGANDPRVKRSEPDQIVKAMQAKNIPVTYVLFPDEGHGFAKPENAIAFSAVTEAFLGQCLGGRVEPVGDDFKASSITIPAGADLLPGVASALPH